jgi:hypothetical protein
MTAAAAVESRSSGGSLGRKRASRVAPREATREGGGEERRREAAGGGQVQRRWLALGLSNLRRRWLTKSVIYAPALTRNVAVHKRCVYSICVEDIYNLGIAITR